MISFEDFVHDLGDFAANYTPEELQQLHVDVLTFAHLLVEIGRARKQARRRSTSPHAPLDAPAHDRTLDKKSNTQL